MGGVALKILCTFTLFVLLGTPAVIPLLIHYCLTAPKTLYVYLLRVVSVRIAVYCNATWPFLDVHKCNKKVKAISAQAYRYYVFMYLYMYIYNIYIILICLYVCMFV